MDEIMQLYEKITDKILEGIFDVLGYPLIIIQKILDQVHLIIEKVVSEYDRTVTNLYGFFRWTTIPLNYIIVRTWLWYIFRLALHEPLDDTGVHLIRSNPGGGKSMLAFQKSNEIADRTGYASYHTSRIEKPHLTEDKKFYAVYHRVINLKNYYKNGKKVMRYNTKLYKSMHVDEFHYLNNSRLNKTNVYNEFFIPFLNDLVLMRHEGFENNIYLYSQVPNNDVQIMSILVHYHEVDLVKGIDYWRWIRTGKFEIVPKYWRIETFNVDRANPTKKKLYRKWKKRVDIDNLTYFDTHAMAHEFDNLPVDYKNK